MLVGFSERATRHELLRSENSAARYLIIELRRHPSLVKVKSTPTHPRNGKGESTRMWGPAMSTKARRKSDQGYGTRCIVLLYCDGREFVCKIPQARIV